MIDSYIISLVAVALAAIVSGIVLRIASICPLILFIAAISFATAYGGLGPGSVAVLCSIAATIHLLRLHLTLRGFKELSRPAFAYTNVLFLASYLAS